MSDIGRQIPGHPAPQTKPQLSTAKKLWFTVVSTIAFFLSAEVLCRIYDSLKTPPQDLSFMSSPVSIMRAHPYFAYETNPDYQQHNSQGFRGTSIHDTQFNGIRIACIGGSTTYGTRVDEREAWPRVLESLLQRRYPDLPIDVINAGVAGYSSHNMLPYLAFRVLPFKPQFVMIDIGHNDVWNTAYFAEERSDNTHAQKVWSTDYQPPELWRQSAFLNKLAWRLGHPPAPPPHIHQVAWHTPSGDPKQNVTASDFEPLRSNLLSLIAVARAHNCIPVLCLQPSDFQHHNGDGIISLGMQKTAALISTIAVNENVALLDLRRQLDRHQDAFADYLHLNSAGEEKRAILTADWLISTEHWNTIVLANQSQTFRDSGR